ncbi:hypothetical protein QCD79_34950, partial [Pseudomonas quasicaspiana]|nr:hypothetical protein [Pseudomonas quasicaspiana]
MQRFKAQLQRFPGSVRRSFNDGLTGQFGDGRDRQAWRSRPSPNWPVRPSLKLRLTLPGNRCNCALNLCI